MLLRWLESEEFPFGPGLFETIRLKNGNPEFLREHLDRLRTSCRTLGWPFPFEIGEVQRNILSHDRKSVARMRLVYKKDPDLWMQFLKAKPVPDFWTLFPRTITPHPLAAHKTTDRQAYEDWRDEAVRHGASDALLVTNDGEILETSRANIFLMIDGKLCTPPADGKILPGVMRKKVIQLAGKLEIPWLEKSIRVDDLKKADEVFATNSILGITPVQEIQGLMSFQKQIPRFARNDMGELTKRLCSHMLVEKLR